MSQAVAIDGPAGAGKSTIAKAVAKKLDYIYVDTGAMYRAMALYFLENNIQSEDEMAINQACDNVRIDIEYQNGEQQIILNSENVTGSLRKEDVGNMASKVSAYKKVRNHLLQSQRELAKSKNVVMDGRDIGTTVLPDANIKIFLTASVEARAQRRFLELKTDNYSPVFEKIKEDIQNRDFQDMNREISPLKKAEDAFLVDSSEIGIEETIERILNIIKTKVM